MPKLELITPKEFGNRKWRAPTNYLFAAHDILCSLVPTEIPKAALHLPIAFTYVKEQLALVAVLGLELENNFLVDANGRWTGGYIPSPYRAYPFFLAKISESDEALCIDTESNLIDVEGADKYFFEADGSPTKRITEIFEFLRKVSESKLATTHLYSTLQTLDLIEAWPIVLKEENENKNIEGLFRVNEKRLGEISSEEFELLRECGALPIIYSQLLSMQNLYSIAQRSHSSFSSIERSSIPKELDFDSYDNDGNISFDVF